MFKVFSQGIMLLHNTIETKFVIQTVTTLDEDIKKVSISAP